MATGEVGDRPVDVGGAFGFAAQAVDTMTGEVANAEKFDRTDIHDAGELAEYKRGKIESDHQGLRGAVSSLYSGVGLVPSYQSEMDTLTEAEDYAHSGDKRSAADIDSQRTRMGLQQLRTQMDAAVADESKPDFQRQRESADANYRQQIDVAGNIANNKTFFSQGFNNQTEANAFANQITHDASAIHDSQLDKLTRARYDEMQTGQDQLDVLKQIGAGDKEGAALSALQAELNAGERKIDPNDTEKVKQFENISAQSLANFDANTARQGKYREAQTEDQISAFQEEAKESQLSAQGRTDDVRTAALDFSTQQRVKSLQEQADAETDPTHKAQLQREIAAASDAGKIERDSLQQELHRTQMTNVQASAMSAASQMGMSGLQGVHDGGGSNLNDAVRNLDNATTKLNKVLSHSKTLVLVKD
jgi:hypothetical protein